MTKPFATTRAFGGLSGPSPIEPMAQGHSPRVVVAMASKATHCTAFLGCGTAVEYTKHSDRNNPRFVVCNDSSQSSCGATLVSQVTGCQEVRVAMLVCPSGKWKWGVNFGPIFWCATKSWHKKYHKPRDDDECRRAAVSPFDQLVDQVGSQGLVRSARRASASRRFHHGECRLVLFHLRQRAFPPIIPSPHFSCFRPPKANPAITNARLC